MVAGVGKLEPEMMGCWHAWNARAYSMPGRRTIPTPRCPRRPNAPTRCPPHQPCGEVSCFGGGAALQLAVRPIYLCWMYEVAAVIALCRPAPPGTLLRHCTLPSGDVAAFIAPPRSGEALAFMHCTLYFGRGITLAI
jgi:hypothetical protein